MIFFCNYCKFSTPQFKLLVEHYIKSHQGKWGGGAELLFAHPQEFNNYLRSIYEQPTNT